MKWTKEYGLDLHITVNGVKILTVKTPKILGVTFDNLCSFNPYITAFNAKIQSCNKIFKSLASCSWGKNKETLLATYKTIGLNYASDASGIALRSITGCP